jgi:hypothetical protein
MGTHGPFHEINWSGGEADPSHKSRAEVENVRNSFSLFIPAVFLYNKYNVELAVMTRLY